MEGKFNIDGLKGIFTSQPTEPVFPTGRWEMPEAPAASTPSPTANQSLLLTGNLYHNQFGMHFQKPTTRLQRQSITTLARRLSIACLMQRTAYGRLMVIGYE